MEGASHLQIRTRRVVRGAETGEYEYSYEYSQITEEIRKLNEKMDTALEKLDAIHAAAQKKQKRCTISEVNTKMDNLLEITKKRKLDL